MIMFDYGIIVRDEYIEWTRETRSNRKETYLPEFGVFEFDALEYSEAMDNKLRELNKDVDAKHSAHESERLATEDWGQCPVHGPDYSMTEDCSCSGYEPTENWASRNHLTYYIARSLHDDEAIYWLEQGAELVN